MLVSPPADVLYDIITVAAPVVGVASAAGLTALVHRWRKRRKGDMDVRTSVRRHEVTLYGAKPSIFEKHPPPGLDDRVEMLEQGHADVTRVQGEHTDLLNILIAKVTPNGGNTRESGDLLLLIARKLDIDVPEGRGHDGEE